MTNQPAPEYKTCKACGKVISPGKNSRRETCNMACKQRWYRMQKVRRSAEEQAGNDQQDAGEDVTAGSVTPT